MSLAQLILQGDGVSYGGLARAADPELRELALEALVRQHGVDAAIQQLTGA